MQHRQEMPMHAQLFKYNLIWSFLYIYFQVIFPCLQPSAISNSEKNHRNYFTSSDPHYDMLGGGCQVRVVIEYDGKNGEFENIDFRFPWLSDTSEMVFGHDIPCLNYSDRLPHPSDLCQPDRVRWGWTSTHLLKCVLLLSTSQTDWKQSSDVLSDISFDILSDISSDISSDILSDISFDILLSLSVISSDILSVISFDILSDISSDILSDISFAILSDISFDMLSDISSDILSDISKPKPNIHSFTKKTTLQTLYLPHTTQQK